MGFADMINSRLGILAYKPVALYGLGQTTMKMLNCKQELCFEIIGVLDKEQKDGEFQGITILNDDNVDEYCSDIIITALGSNRELIYNRIRERVKSNIWYLDGENRRIRKQLGLSFIVDEERRISDLIDRNDVISFDIFDTILYRRCLYPEKVYELINGEGFAGFRKTANKRVGQIINRIPNIYEIYSYLGIKQDVKIELQIEQEMLCLRGDVIRIYQYALQHKKNIVFTSDTWFTSEWLKTVLKALGINSFDKIYASCELNKSKANCDIWESLKHDYPSKSILHIGDECSADSFKDEAISSYIIKPTVELLTELGFDRALRLCETVSDNIVLGTVLGKLITTNTFEAKDVGYAFIAPQIISFCNWLYERARENGDNDLLFCSRDTYLVFRLWNEIYNDSGITTHYFYCSKRMLLGMLCDNMTDIKQGLDFYGARFNKETCVNEALFRLFGAKIPESSFGNKRMKEVSYDSVLSYCNENIGYFVKNARKEAYNFNKYLMNNHFNSRMAVVDFVCGQSVLLLRRFFEGNIYLHGTTDCNGIKQEHLYSYLPEVDNASCPKYHILKNSQFSESIFSSHEGTVLMFDEDGEPVLDIERIDFSINDKLFEGVLDFHRSCRYMANPVLADEIYGVLFNGIFNIDFLKHLKWSSYTANKYGGVHI